MPSHPDLQQLALVVFFITATSVNTQPALVVVTLSATCTGSLFPSSTGTYTACTLCDLHCGGGGGGDGGDGGIYVVVVGACDNMLFVCRCGLYKYIIIY